MAGQKQDDQLEHTSSSYVRIRDEALKTCHRRWTTGRSGKRGSGISVPVAWHDDDDNSHIHVHNPNISGNIVNNNDELQWTNEHTSLKKYISHALFSKCWCFLCVRDELVTGRDCSTSFSSWLGCSTVGLWGPKYLCLQLAHILASCFQLTQTVSTLVILFFNIHLLPLFFRLFTQVHILIDRSVEGQPITILINQLRH